MTASLRILGIDPGLVGGWAVVDTDGALIAAGDIPVAGSGAGTMVSAPLVAAIVNAHGPDVACVESVHSMPRQGVASSFKFGRAVGVVEGVIGSIGLRVHHVTPQAWKKYFNLSSDKEQSRQRAINMWPEKASLFFSRKRDKDRAEAALIAEWYRAKVLGGASE